MVYLPPYSPDFNSIENVFAKLKTLVRKVKLRKMDELWRKLGELCDIFSSEECKNYFQFWDVKPLAFRRYFRFYTRPFCFVKSSFEFPIKSQSQSLTWILERIRNCCGLFEGKSPHPNPLPEGEGTLFGSPDQFRIRSKEFQTKGVHP